MGDNFALEQGSTTIPKKKVIHLKLLPVLFYVHGLWYSSYSRYSILSCSKDELYIEFVHYNMWTTGRSVGCTAKRISIPRILKP